MRLRSYYVRCLFSLPNIVCDMYIKFTVTMTSKRRAVSNFHSNYNAPLLYFSLGAKPVFKQNFDLLYMHIMLIHCYIVIVNVYIINDTVIYNNYFI